MFRLLRCLALGVSTVVLGGPAFAQPTPGPPDWQDGGSSVYLAVGRKDRPTVESTKPVAELTSVATAPATPIASAVANETIVPPQPTTTRKFDTNVVPSAHQEPLPADESSGRRLAPPSVPQKSESPNRANGHADSGARRVMDLGIPAQSIYTIVTALTIVIGAFLLFVWVLKRGGRGGAGRRGILPAEAVSVLGKVALTGRQAAELLRVGNKLVLVALTPNGAEALTEVTDPAEVDRLVGLCQQHDSHSTTRAFEQVFQNLTRESAHSGFLGADELPSSMSPIAAAYGSQRGNSTRA